MSKDTIRIEHDPHYTPNGRRQQEWIMTIRHDANYRPKHRAPHQRTFQIVHDVTYKLNHGRYKKGGIEFGLPANCPLCHSKGPFTKLLEAEETGTGRIELMWECPDCEDLFPAQ